MSLVLAQAILGAVQGRITPSHSQDIWDRAAGFPGGYVYSMAQTRNGYLWIGTSKGLVRYDGLTFVSIPEGDSSVETKFPVVGLVTDSSDHLWAADDRTHVFRYDAGRLVGPLIDRAGPINKTRDGWLLFASETQGLVVFRFGVAHVLLDARMIPSSPTAVAQAADSTFWIGTRDHGVFHFKLTQGAPEVQHLPGLPDTKINCLLPIGTSTLLIGTDKGLLSVHGGKLEEVHHELTNLEILALASGRDRDVWIGAGGNLFRADVKDIDVDGRIHSLDRSSLRFSATSLFEDRTGNLWIGGPESIERYRASGFTTLLSSAGLPCTNCGSIYVDDQGSVWFAPWDGGLFRLAQGSIQPISVSGLTDDTVYSIAGGGGEVWVARKYGGVTRFQLHGDELQTSTYTQRNGLGGNAVYSIYRAPDGTVWAGTLEEGLSRFRDCSWHTFTTRDGLPSKTISVITGNAAGEIVVGTPNGLAVLSNNRWVTYAAHDGLPPGAIESLFLDKLGTLWIGTAKGISFLQSGTVHVPVTAPDVLYGEILGMAETNGWLWVTTSSRVLRVRCSALQNDFFGAGDYREFGVNEGLPSVEGVKRSRSVVNDTHGQIWFSLNQGISVLTASAFAGPAFPVTIRLDGMLMDGKFIAPNGQIRVPAGRHRLTFQYAGVNVSSPETVRYRYRLDNVDAAWSEPTASREVGYTNIPPGQFRFSVMARDPDGRWSGHEAVVSFEVEPAYWQTRWFQVATVAALVLLAWSLYRLRLWQMTARMDLGYRERLAERTRIARELHDTLLQSFHGLLLRFQAVSNLLPARPEEAKQRLDGAIDQAVQAITESRDAVHELRLSADANNDLSLAISALAKELAADQTSGNCPDVRVQVEGTPRDLHPILRDEVYRIAAEALRNACRYSEARRIEVEIRYDEGQLRLRVRDNGKGINLNMLTGDRSLGHWGLYGMRERAKVVSGKLDVWSKPDSGTEVELTVPASVAYGTSPAPVRFFLRKIRMKS
ncbi:MAG TPA: two-component regulator propeller domain-containing protein [Bryobacteraceae bacterium]|nr:two-component regulator propeller domain-containing protein [Bryobacteraceae bacterium]